MATKSVVHTVVVETLTATGQRHPREAVARLDAFVGPKY
jgi:hypothetical protein